MPPTMAPPKQKIPYELKNRREWDPNFVGEPLSDSGESESDTSSDEWVEGGIASESESTGGESSRNIASVPASRRSGGPEEDDGQGWQTVQTKGKTRPSNTPSRNNLPPQASRTNLQKYVHAQVSSQSLQTRRPAQAHHRRPVPVTRQRKVVPPDAKGNRLIKPFFNFARDNRAKTAYRQRKPPDGNYQLHKNPNEIEPDIKRLYDMLAEVGVRCNSFLIPPQSWNERNILIWGDTRALAKTRAALTDWLRRAEEGPVQRAKGKDAFTTENSTIGHLHKMELKRLRNEIELKSFQQVPDPGRHFEHQGWYPWRVEELDPKEVFGHSMEAFDTVRHECKCHIVFNDRLECFRIYTDCKDSVEHALSRIRGAHESIRQQSQYPIIKFMVNPPSATSALSQIQLSKSQPTKDTEQFSKIPRLSGPALDAKGRSTWDQQSRRSTADNQKWIEESFKKLWPRLKFYDGHLHMRIGFDLLSPENLSSQSLAESRPTFVGRFLIHRFDRPSIIYETILQPDSLDSIKYDIGASTWSRSDRKGAKAPLDFTMVQVDGYWNRSLAYRAT
ncbi:uncharacterized protein KY384_002132 [Bacidia gigantensis]|uniref:uncharacterized protein n=1 Tax=Bacidia gigantensis TaxID=2732470 RepID=UPI001D059B61|nr:uncharacterized protein KY384_002132 [Bacidia gigantensis]KAG8533349.1 hypothetical protein KY384_002132 [Bacidia gigantensis]